ncbi:MAG: hypothetical protein AAF108_01540 [Planctomycetota bacterium]
MTLLPSNVRRACLAAGLCGSLALAGSLVGCSSSDGDGSVYAGASNETPAATRLVSGQPVNGWCPIGNEPVGDAGGGTVMHNGKTVAFCCPGCREQWPLLTAAQKDEFVELSLMGNEQSFSY